VDSLTAPDCDRMSDSITAGERDRTDSGASGSRSDLRPSVLSLAGSRSDFRPSVLSLGGSLLTSEVGNYSGRSRICQGGGGHGERMEREPKRGSEAFLLEWALFFEGGGSLPTREWLL